MANLKYVSSDRDELQNTVTANTGARSGGSIWNRLLDNASNIIGSVTGGISSIVQAKTGNYPTIQEDNTPKVLAIAGVGAIVLIIILVIIFKK